MFPLLLFFHYFCQQQILHILTFKHVIKKITVAGRKTFFVAPDATEAYEEWSKCK